MVARAARAALACPPPPSRTEKEVLGTRPAASTLQAPWRVRLAHVPPWWCCGLSFCQVGRTTAPGGYELPWSLCPDATGIPATTGHPEALLQLCPVTETIPSLPPLAVPPGLPQRPYRREAVVFAQILTRPPATGADGISPGLIQTKRTLCFSDSPWEKNNPAVKMKTKEERKHWKSTFPSYLFPLLTACQPRGGVRTARRPPRSRSPWGTAAMKHRGGLQLSRQGSRVRAQRFLRLPGAPKGPPGGDGRQASPSPGTGLVFPSGPSVRGCHIG